MLTCNPFDAAVAALGPPAIFVPDAEGLWRLEPDLSRDAWQRLGQAPAPDPAYGLLRDRATGYVSLVWAGSRALLEGHPRASLRWYPTEEEARAARAALGAPYLDPQPPPEGAPNAP